MSDKARSTEDPRAPNVKQGYLLIQTPGAVKWKGRWFRLTEDKVCCYRKQRSRSCVTSLGLLGCSVVCSDDTSGRETILKGLFKIFTPNGDEYSLLAAGRDDCNEWAHAISAVIRSLTSDKMIRDSEMSFQTVKVMTNISEIVGAIQESEAGVELQTIPRGERVYRNCFTGSDIVDWLLRWSIVTTRDDGASLAQTLHNLGHLQEVEEDGGVSGGKQLYQDSDKLYRFTSLNLHGLRNSYFDYNSDDSSSSEEEDDDGDDVTDSKYKTTEKQHKSIGRVVQEGFLMKKYKKKLRSGCRLYRVVLREKPNILELTKVSKVHTDSTPVVSKVIDLAVCRTVDKSKQEPTTDEGEKSISKYRISINNSKGKKTVLVLKDETEWRVWLDGTTERCGTSGLTLKSSHETLK